MVRRMWLLSSIVVAAAGCGPSAEPEGEDAGGSSGGEDDLPSCDGEPYDDACEMEFAALCESRTDATACEGTESLPGGLSLECLWIEPSLVVVDGSACSLEPAEPRCVGIAFPGDIACTMWLEEGGQTLYLEPERCFPIGWNECESAMPACGCR